jgi:addiction module RelE/StbE family toxin
MAWKVEFDPRAEKDLRAIDQVAPPRFDFFEKLASHPDPAVRAKPLQGRLKGCYRYRIHDLRAIVSIRESNSVITILKVGHRKKVHG